MSNKNRDENIARGGNLYPYAGIIRIRFNGYVLSLWIDTPKRFRDKDNLKK